MNNSVFRIIMKNVKIHDIKLVTKGRRRNYLVSEPPFHTTMFSKEHLLHMKKWKNEK